MKQQCKHPLERTSVVAHHKHSCDLLLFSQHHLGMLKYLTVLAVHTDQHTVLCKRA